MLDPAKRHSFFDFLAPPPGYVLEAGFGTTYSAQFDVLTAATLALLGEETEDLARTDIVSALHAIGRLRDRFRLFVHQGGFSHDSVNRAQRLFALYDRFVRAVPLPGGAFHPKTWVLKFTPRRTVDLRSAKPEYRVLCMSRNLTSSHCWELGVALTGHRSEDTSEPGRSLGRFALRLAEADPSGADALRTLAGELPQVTFQASREGQHGLDFHWQWPGETSRGALIEHLPPKAHRALVLSPFVRKEIVERLASYDRLTLVALQPELDQLPDALFQELRARGHELLVLEPEEAAREGETLSGGLHAKLYVIEHASGSTTLVGSANATSAAWGTFAVSNVETVLALSPGLSQDRARRELIAKERDLYHPWIQEYRRQELSESAQEKAERAVDRVIRALATARFQVAYAPKLRRLDLRVIEQQPFPGGGPAIRVDMAPYLLLHSGRPDLWRSLDEAMEGCRYEDVDERDTSAFVVVRIVSKEAAVERLQTFYATNVGSGALGDGRDEALVRQIVEESRLDPLALLSRLLGWRRARPGGGGRKGDGEGREPESLKRASLLDDFSIESVLERCTEDESSISEVDSFLSTFGNEIDPAFVDFWQRFKDALQRHRGRP